jgi:hypothetical protein
MPDTLPAGVRSQLGKKEPKVRKALTVAYLIVSDFCKHQRTGSRIPTDMIENGMPP